MLILNSFVFAAPAGPTVLLQDDFSDANGTAINGKALDVGGTWSNGEGASAAATTEGGYVVPSTNGLTSFKADAGVSDVTMRIVWDFQSAGWPGFSGFTFRMNSGGLTYYLLAMSNATTIELYEFPSATFLASWTPSSLPQTPWTLEAVISGASITIDADGQSLAPYGSLALTSNTYFGFRFFAANVPHTRADDFEVTT
jgi:hypothetical protein